MDFRLALLLNTFTGLELSDADLGNLLSLDPLYTFEPQPVLQALESVEAKSYVASHKGWWRDALEILHKSEDRGIRWSYRGQPDFPEAWNFLSKDPLLFSYRGQPLWKDWALISVVGSRTPMTDTCLWMQREFSRFLKERQVCVVSGGARGIDQWAHRLALAAGRPTVCVFPSGLLNPYPPSREDLWESILIQDGCLLSTFPLHRGMNNGAFHVRNRWITGLSPATFIVEANRRSGTHMTARFALEEGREIATLPVSANATQGLANLDLLANGATLIRDYLDLASFFDRNSRPSFAQRIECKDKEQGIDQPEPQASGDPTIAGGAFSGTIQ